MELGPYRKLLKLTVFLSFSGPKLPILVVCQMLEPVEDEVGRLRSFGAIYEAQRAYLQPGQNLASPRR